MTDSPTNTKDYYDRFSATYEKERHHGYHKMLDELEMGAIEKYGRGADIFEAGCGTGLLLNRAKAFAKTCAGVDLSAGMLGPAAKRGLGVVQGSITDIPVKSESFDLVYSMKVLPHIPLIKEALAEMSRLLRPGGHILCEFYNPYSLRYLGKKYGGPAPIAEGTNDHDVFTRYDTVAQASAYLPPDTELITTRGVRIFTPVASAHNIPVFGGLLARAEKAAADLPLIRNLAGFVILVARKKHS